MAKQSKDKGSAKTIDLTDSFVIAVSSRALFDLSAEHEVFVNEGLKAYCDFQIKNEDVDLPKGPGFALIEALLKLNDGAKDQARPVEVIVMSHNSADTSMRMFNSIKSYDLSINRAALTSGRPLAKYLHAYSCDLFLSATEADVIEARDAGVAAAQIYETPHIDSETDGEIRIAFDGDAVIFSDESEKVFQEQGLEAFIENETTLAKEPLSEGPMFRVLRALHYLKNKVDNGDKRIRIALVTARDNQSIERVIRTLRAWHIDIDEAFFMGGVPKTDILKAFGAQMFFDDQSKHCEGAKQEALPSAQVI